MQKHRAFNYKENKINRMSKADLYDHLFTTKIDPDKLRYVLMTEKETQISIRKAKLLKWRIEDKIKNENMDMNKEIIEVIYDLKEVFPFKLSECLAITKHYLNLLCDNPGMLKEQAYQEAIENHVTDWDTSMQIL